MCLEAEENHETLQDILHTYSLLQNETDVNNIKTSVPTSQKSLVFFTKKSRFKKIIAVYSENHKPMHSVWVRAKGSLIATSI
jgi:hypothetical protein